MRLGLGGLALASILVLSGCSKPETPPPAPAGFSIALTDQTHGKLDAQTNAVTVKGKKGDYSASVTMTPAWWVSGTEFKIVWYAGLSQTKRFFQIADEKGDAADKPDYIANPEQGVREVKVSFDGGAPVSMKPTTPRAPFAIPAGAKAVTSVEMDFGSPDAPQSYVWK